MKTILLALSFASLSTLSTFVNASSLTLAFPADPDSDSDGGSLPSPTIWADPIGTASDGSATTYILNEIDSGDVALFGDVQTGTNVATTSFTVIASASGYIFPDLDSISAACTLDSSNSVVCVEVGAADVGETGLVTITETGSASLFVAPISAPTQTATSGSGSSSGSGASSSSGSPSGSGSSTGSSSPSSTGSASSNQNGAGKVGPRFLSLIIAGLLAGVSLVL